MKSPHPYPCLELLAGRPAQRSSPQDEFRFAHSCQNSLPIQGRLKYTLFIFFLSVTILYFANIKVYAIDNKVEAKISANLTHNYYGPTIEIEKLFRENINLGEHVKYTIVPRGLIVSIASSVFFEDGHDEILESSKPVLTSIAQILKSLNNDCIVEGNTEFYTYQDSEYQSNWELSIVRAEKITDYLIKTEQVNPLSITSVGFGEFDPIKNGIGIRNDRIDFVIINYDKIVPLR